MLIIWASQRAGSGPASNWILALGIWNDGGDWIDIEVWID